MKWSDAYATGIDQLDRHHQMLFAMSEDFRVALDEGGGERSYGSMLESLANYARGHFGIEEACMARYHCPVAEANSGAHARFMEALKGFQQRQRIRGFSRPDAYELVEFLDRWLADHIARIDVKLRTCIKEIKE